MSFGLAWKLTRGYHTSCHGYDLQFDLFNVEFETFCANIIVAQ